MVDEVGFEVQEGIVNHTVVEILGKSVKQHCTCNGRDAHDPLACLACKVWHQVREEIRERI